MSADLEPMPDNVKLWGRAKSQEELAKLYSEADMTLLLSQGETFSMVTAESLCCGTPVIGFKAGGPESIAISSASKFVEYGNVNLLIHTIIDEIDVMSKNIFSAEAQGLYDSTVMVKEYLKVYERFI